MAYRQKWRAPIQGRSFLWLVKYCVIGVDIYNRKGSYFYTYQRFFRKNDGTVVECLRLLYELSDYGSYAQEFRRDTRRRKGLSWHTGSV